ncbi:MULTISPECIES: transglutaminase domain-containing protein [unclassified Paenibacillus]|uniref:transglutaminase family protein n=1 Tax=unclassified Paenibacillus TaxID=185978 RepID=UPI002474F2AB|nr:MULTISPECIES: transglutaminase domain-containing protein [unclassified Paenibacillus]MDH6429126.1 transglutaminase-like putative cysteine protease [Paenibacillus sp. PastH-4]MDH6445332.1 transglutaminase-like putative cysteine protease [Paenibacillus sp. PastF-4]MDH6529221.1 transglutaminase-like putative cysteine protease [Paenibacillus sp. PastH-3]
MNHPENQRYGKRIPGDTSFSMNEHSGKEPKQLHLEKLENSHAGKQRKIPLYYRMLFSLAILGLFLEWLLPLYRTTSLEDTARLLQILMISAAVLLMWGILQIPGWLLLSIQCLMIGTAWLYLCSEGVGTGWLGIYAVEIPNDLILLFSGHVSQLSEISRLLILIVGWGLLVSSVQQLALFRGSTLLFTAVTLIYLLVLDIGFGVNTTTDVVISVGLIVWMQAMSGLLRLRERVGSIHLPYARWGVLALAAAIFVMMTAWFGGQVYEVRPPNQTTLQSTFEKLQEWASGHMPEDNEAIPAGTTGYSTNDGELGAPLSRNTEPVFTALTSQRTYWRGESIAYYDGRRWIRGGEEFTPLNLSSLPQIPATVTTTNGGRTLQQRIQFAIPSSGGIPVFNAGTITDVETVQLSNGSQLGYVLANKDRDTFRLPDSVGSTRITEYIVDSILPESNPVLLRGLGDADPQEIKNKYLQLPDLLPERVKALAEKLTASSGNRYDSATAIRDYLQNGYSYTLDTMVPPAGADFVDHFLFETKQGYCVHFATAMTVLLRSTGIPARYVQGYGPGTQQEEAMPAKYLVTQGDAHAWVEVYFAGAGWVPFDPTPGPALAAGFPAPARPAAAAIAPQATRSAELPALPLAGGPFSTPLTAAALLPAAAWRWRRSLALLLAARRGSSLSRERQLRAASMAWHGLAERFGPPPPGVTGREYVDSLRIYDAGLDVAVRQFVRQWETLAYAPASASTAVISARDNPVDSAPALGGEPAASDAAAFIRECLLITFRLT